MKLRIAAAAGAMFLLLGTPASAHRLDEYLQATTILLEKDRIQTELRLTPGAAVFPAVFASIDTNGDRVISLAEQRAYAERVLREVTLTVDGDRLHLRLVSWKFAKTEEMKEGRGDIQLNVDARVSHGGRSRRLVFVNHHQSRIAVYLVNCLVPSDPDIQITSQNRSYQQSSYRLDYVQTGGVGSAPPPRTWRASVWGWLGAGTAALVLFTQLALRWRKRATPEEGREL